MNELSKQIPKKEENPEWVPSEEETIKIFQLARKTRRVSEFAYLLKDKANQCFLPLVRNFDSEYSCRIFENQIWRQAFESNIPSMLKLIKDNQNINTKEFLERYNEENDYVITERVFKTGSREDIQVYEKLLSLDWSRDLIGLKVLSYLSLNPQWKELVTQLISEKKIDLNSKDELGRNLVLQACTLDVDVSLIKFLVEEKSLALERDV